MENHRQYTVIVSKAKQGYKFEKLMVSATSKWHALDLAYYKYPEYTEYQCSNVVRHRDTPVQEIINKF